MIDARARCWGARPSLKAERDDPCPPGEHRRIYQEPSRRCGDLPLRANRLPFVPMTESPELPASFDERAWLVAADHAASQTYDKLVVALGGGALGLSLAFMRDVVQSPESGTVGWLAWAWVLLALSLLCTFTSLLTSQAALRLGMHQLDEEDGARLGGAWTVATWTLNIAAGVLLVTGVLLLVVFALLNL